MSSSRTPVTILALATRHKRRMAQARLNSVMVSRSTPHDAWQATSLINQECHRVSALISTADPQTSERSRRKCHKPTRAANQVPAPYRSGIAKK